MFACHCARVQAKQLASWSARPAGNVAVCHRPGPRRGAAAVPGAADGSVLRSGAGGGHGSGGRDRGFPRKLICPADTKPRHPRVLGGSDRRVAALNQPLGSPAAWLGVCLADSPA